MTSTVSTHLRSALAVGSEAEFHPSRHAPRAHFVKVRRFCMIMSSQSLVVADVSIDTFISDVLGPLFQNTRAIGLGKGGVAELRRIAASFVPEKSTICVPPPLLG